ncbi:MAG: lysine-2,3-aminomutase-like protein [Myxococcales bacterium]|nr:lysine-2,3-aminomutase-like protein [Myxococcales bacterium]
MTSRPIKDVDGLVREGLVAPKDAAALTTVAERFQIGVSGHLVGRLRREGLRRQFVPDPRELVIAPEELEDPIGDAAYSPTPGIVHRYPDRALLMPTTLCAVYCRFCFRREVVGDPAHTLDDAALARALAYLAARREIWEVILTGGDPLVLSPRRLGRIVAALAEIDHVQTLRIHSRVPVTNPERITPALLTALRGRLPVTVVIHTNHVDELSVEARAACARLVDAGVPLRSQTVLLRGVNDSVAALEALMRGLVASRVMPYYLHLLDRARGTSHFRVPIEVAQRLVRELRGRVSGLCQPTLVLDIPGGHGKVPVGPAYLEGRTGRYTVTDVRGQTHAYVESGAGAVESAVDAALPSTGSRRGG